MARCEMCLKSGQSGNNVSHSKRRTKRRWHANIQRATIYVDGAAKRVKICTRCLRNQYRISVRA